MIATLISVLAATAATSGPLAIPHIKGALLDNSCRHSVEEANYPIAPALYDSGRAPLLQKLGDLPDANEEILVNRTLDGCPAPVVVVRNVLSRPR